MEEIAHLWSVNQFMTKLKCPQTKNLQTFYLQSCKNRSQGADLPRQQFGPSVMCTHCNSLWSTVDHKIRVMRGRAISKSVGKILESMQNKDKRIPKVRLSLGKKAIERRTNKLAITCSVCLRVTKVPLVKPKREKVKRAIVAEALSAQKRRKKKSKDRTAGLNIPGKIQQQSTVEIKVQSEKHVTKLEHSKKSITSVQKLKKLNLNRLKDIVSKSVTPAKSKSLHSFLSEL